MKPFIEKLRANFELWQAPIVAIAIIVFGFATVYSTFSLLNEEKQAMEMYRIKNLALLELEDRFNDLQRQILIDINSSQPDEQEFNKISAQFSDFQESFIFFDRRISGQNTLFNSTEAQIIRNIQSHIINIAASLRDNNSGPDLSRAENILTNIEGIHGYLGDFAAYQLKQERQILSPETMENRHYAIVLSVTLMGVAGFLLMIFLLHKNRQLERANRERLEMYHLSEERMLAMEASSDGIGIIDDKGRLIYMNEALRDLHGIPEAAKERFLQQPWTQLYTENGRQEIEQSVLPKLEKEGSWRGESKLVRQDGKVIDAELSLTKLPHGKGMIGTGRDISERLAAEKEKIELQSQIYQAQKMEAIGRLAGGIAHDFNNILAAINGYAEFLSEDLSHDPEKKIFAQNILKAGEKAREVVDQMLAFSRRDEQVKTFVDLQNIIEETISMVSASLPKTIDLNVEISHDRPCIIQAETSRITQALMNLCVNAFDAIEDERGTLCVSLALIEPDETVFGQLVKTPEALSEDLPLTRIQELEEGHTCLEVGSLLKGQSYYQLSVSDTGMGMARNVMEHIFEPFFTTKPVDKGTGLGMANVHGTVLSHEGALVVESILQEGTTIDLFFPVADIAEMSLSNELDRKPAQEQIHGHILLVDDEPQVLEMLEKLLSRNGFTCESCHSAMEALQIIKENKEAFDLVITDQNMPKMTGVELIEQVAMDQPELAFIILSGFSHEQLQELQERFSNICLCLHKPIKGALLIQAVGQILADVTRHAA